MDKDLRLTLSALATSLGIALLVGATPAATNIHPWITIGRVTYLVIQSYSYTGAPLLDICLALILPLSASMLFGEKRRVIMILPVGLAGLMLLITKHVLPAYIMAWITMLIYSLITIRAWGPKTIMYGLLGLLGGLGAYKVFYVLTRIITGYYPVATTPVWLDLVINYYSWPLIPVVIAATALISLYLLLAHILGLDSLPRRIRGWLEGPRISRGLGGKERILLLFSITLSFFLAVMPFIHSINPSGRPITTDYIYYYNWLRESLRYGVGQVMLARSDRPLYILLLYTLMRISGASPSAVSALQDIVLFPLYTFSAYLLARRTMGGGAAGYAALMAASSPILLSYAYGGFQADLFTLSMTLIALSMILGEKRRTCLAGLVLLGITMFLHDWTWTQYTIILAAYAAATAFRAWRRREGLGWRWRMITLYLAVSIPIDLVKTIVFGLFSSAEVIATMSRSSSLMGFGGALHFYTTLYTGGSLDNTLFYILALPGLFAAHSLILAAAGLSLITVLIPYNIMYYRLLLNTPLPLLAGYTVSRMSKGMRILVLLEMIGLALLRILSFIPGLSLTP